MSESEHCLHMKMSKKQSTPKTKASASLWSLCEDCKVSVPSREVDVHSANCPPILHSPNHSFIVDNILYGKLDSKSNDAIKGLSEEQKDLLVFASQSAMMLCGLAIGDSVRVASASPIHNSIPFVANIWPMSEKSCSAILLTKIAIDTHKLGGQIGDYLTLTKHNVNLIAKKIQLVITNAPSALEVTNELRVRLNNHYHGQSVMKGNLLTLLYYGKLLKLEVKSVIGVDPDNLAEEIDKLDIKSLGSPTFHQITSKTNILIYKDEQRFQQSRKAKLHTSMLGGLEYEIQELQLLIETALSPLSAATRNCIEPCKGVLLYGQSGTGKTILVKAIAQESKASVFEINATKLYGSQGGNVEENAKKLFEEARNSLPAIILMDEVEVLCPARTSRITEAEKRIVACILNGLDAILTENNVFILATTNKIDSVDEALRRCGRFDREIEIPVPNPVGRQSILRKLVGSSCDEETIQHVAFNTHGFVGADLKSLCSVACIHSRSKTIDFDDFKLALTKVRASAMREVQIEVPNVQWRDIGGQHKLKLILQQCVEWPLKHPESFQRLGIHPPRGVLMYGPPGCSKTMIAKALATESSLNFLSIKGPELFSKWVGESEKAIRSVFRKARQVAPSIIFFDEIDALGGERSTSAASGSSVQERVLAQLLTELDGVTSLGDVIILAATNRPDRIDNALLRPGRLDRIVYVPLPDTETRREIFQIKIAKMPTYEVDIDELVASSEGYSGAEVNAVCHEAAMMALEEDLQATSVGREHFRKAFELVTPRTPSHLLKMYEDYQSK